MRAAAYARYSTNRQQHNSIEYQLDAIRAYCREHGVTLASVYTDEGKSGTNTDRPGLQALMADAERGEFEAVVIYDITRGSRDVGDWFTMRKRLLTLGVQMISTTQPLGDLTSGNDFLLELLNVGLGHREVLETRSKSIAGVAVKAREGKFLGGVAPLGYDIVDGSYVVNPAEARIVRTIFALYGTGRSYRDILDAVSGAVGKRGRPLGKNSLHSILTNERYIGTYSWNKRRVKLFRKWAGGAPNPDAVRIEGMIPAIIDADTWEKVRQRMSDNKRNARNKAKRAYLLSGLIECEACGAACVGHTSTSSRGTETRYYVCGNRYRTRTCGAKSVNADELETFVVQQLKAYLLGMDFGEEARRIAGQVNGSSPDLRAEQAELTGVTAQINNGLRAVLNGMDIPELRDEIDRLRVRRAELEDIISRRTARRAAVDPQDIERLFEDAVENWDTDLPAIIRQHVGKIYAHTDGSCSVNVGIHLSCCGGAQYSVCAAPPPRCRGPPERHDESGRNTERRIVMPLELQSAAVQRTPETFGKNLRAIQESRRLSIQKFADTLVVSKSTLQPILVTGNTSLDTACRIADRLQMSLDALTGDIVTCEKLDVLQCLLQGISWFHALSAEERCVASQHIRAVLEVISK